MRTVRARPLRRIPCCCTGGEWRRHRTFVSLPATMAGASPSDALIKFLILSWSSSTGSNPLRNCSFSWHSLRISHGVRHRRQRTPIRVFQGRELIRRRTKRLPEFTKFSRCVGTRSSGSPRAGSRHGTRGRRQRRPGRTRVSAAHQTDPLQRSQTVTLVHLCTWRQEWHRTGGASCSRTHYERV